MSLFNYWLGSGKLTARPARFRSLTWVVLCFSQNIVHAADKKPKCNRRGHGKKSKQGHQDKMSPRVPCKFCGTNHPYDRSKCPASGKTCLKCGNSLLKLTALIYITKGF